MIVLDPFSCPHVLDHGCSSNTLYSQTLQAVYNMFVQTHMSTIISRIQRDVWSIWRYPVRSSRYRRRRRHQWRHTHVGGCTGNEKSQKTSDVTKTNEERGTALHGRGAKTASQTRLSAWTSTPRAPLLRLTKSQPLERTGKTTRQCPGPGRTEHTEKKKSQIKSSKKTNEQEHKQFERSSVNYNGFFVWF